MVASETRPQLPLLPPPLLPPMTPPDSPTPPSTPPPPDALRLDDYRVSDHPGRHHLPTYDGDSNYNDLFFEPSSALRGRTWTIDQMIEKMISDGYLVPVSPRPDVTLYAPVAHDEPSTPEQQPRNPAFHSRPPPPSPIQPRRRRFTQRELDAATDVDQTGFSVNFIDANGHRFSFETGYYAPFL